MKEIFENYLENAFGKREQAVFKFKQFEINYKKYFPENKMAKVLDIGVGRGEMLSCFKNWGYENYYGIDISPSTIDFCKSLGLKCELVVDTDQFLLEHPETFDLITLLDVLEHIPREKIVSLLKNIRYSLKKGGILIIQVPNLQAPDGYLHRYNDITHMVGFIEHSLQQVLIAAGFSEFHFQGFEEIVDNKIKSIIKKSLRRVYWQIVYFRRKITCNLNPRILHPILSVIVKK